MNAPVSGPPNGVQTIPRTLSANAPILGSSGPSKRCKGAMLSIAAASGAGRLACAKSGKSFIS